MYYGLAHGLGLLIYLMVWVLDLNTQDTDSIILYLLPGLFIFTVVVWVVGFVRVQARSYLL
jgi:hypothetical protein